MAVSQPPLLCCQFTADKKCLGLCFAQCCNAGGGGITFLREEESSPCVWREWVVWGVVSGG